MTTQAQFHVGFSYPIELVTLKDKPVLIAGAGRRAASKVPSLLAAGASIHVIAPEISEDMTRWFFEVERIERRRARADDVVGKSLVIAATNDPEANRMIVRAARAHRVLVSSVDDPEGSDFFAPAVVRRGPVHFTIGTSGASPLLASQLRRVLDATIPENVAEIGDWFGKMRRLGLRGSRRRTRLLSALADAKLSRLVDLGRFEEAEDRLKQLLDEPEEKFAPGVVSIIGAGPGSKSLLTLRALDRIQRAEVVLHDTLVGDEVRALVLPGTRVRCVGRRGRDNESPRDHRETIAMMIDESKSGKRIARLHGGDALIFGRGGEEIEALGRAGVPFEVVPGVSSVVACAAAAGVPLTRRRVARAFTVRTAHAEGGEPTGAIGREEETVVVMMGLGALERVVHELIAEGRSPDLPAIMVSRASTNWERVVRGTLATIAGLVNDAGLQPPATLVAGRALAADLGVRREAEAPRT